jgi:cobalt-zinc-cadmium resistance protein CzcA
MNHDGTLPPGVKVVSFYDRMALVGVTTHTVLHNLIFGCLLVFLIQWIFLGDLRSAIIVGVNIPFALFFAIILLVLQGEDANLLVGGRGRLRHHHRCGGHSGREHFPQSSGEGAPDQTGDDRGSARGNATATIPRVRVHKSWTNRLRLIYISSVAGRQGHPVFGHDHGGSVRPLFTMQGVEGQIFGPMARTYGYALAGALIATFTVTPVLSSLLVPEHVKEVETFVVRWLHDAYKPVLRFALAASARWSASAWLSAAHGPAHRFWAASSCRHSEEGNFWIRASLPPSMTLDAGTEATRKMREILLSHPEVVTVIPSTAGPTTAAILHRSPTSNCSRR